MNVMMKRRHPAAKHSEKSSIKDGGGATSSKRWKRERLLAVSCFLMLAVTSILSCAPAPLLVGTNNENNNHNSTHQHCVIHIHSLHHSGTGSNCIQPSMSLSCETPFHGNKFCPDLTRDMSNWPKSPLFLPVVWWNVWTHVLQQLSQNMVESFVVVQYETLIQQPYRVSRELSSYIHTQCGPLDTNGDGGISSHENHQRRRRRLNLHANITDSSKYLVSRAAIHAFTKCRRNERCNQFLSKASNILQQDFGYHWNPRIKLQPSGESTLLFTSDKLPSMELVQRMKDVAVVAGE